MGEAKRRGSFEERRLEAIKKDAEKAEERERQRQKKAEEWAAMTPQERANRKWVEAQYAQFFALAEFGSAMHGLGR